jgi:hypothetical protein
MSLIRPELEHTAESARALWTPTRTRIARALMVLAALSALVATVSDTSTVFGAGPSTIVVQTWRLYGFALFAGLFTFLAVNLKGHRGIWELVIMNKLLLTCTAIGYAIHGGIAETGDVLFWDGSLTVLLISAYITCQGWNPGVGGPRDRRAPSRRAGASARVRQRSAARRSSRAGGRPRR